MKQWTQVQHVSEFSESDTIQENVLQWKGNIQKQQKNPKVKKAIDQLHKETSQLRKQKQRPISAIELRQETFDNKLIMAKKHPIPM